MHLQAEAVNFAVVTQGSTTEQLTEHCPAFNREKMGKTKIHVEISAFLSVFLTLTFTKETNCGINAALRFVA